MQSGGTVGGTLDHVAPPTWNTSSLRCLAVVVASVGGCVGAAGTDSSSESGGLTTTTTTSGGGGETSATEVTSTTGTTSGETGTGPSTSASSDESTGDPPFFDVEAQFDVAPSCDCNSYASSYVFVANTSESTLSKINTRTLQEEARYLTRETPGRPSRTSVSIDGRAVVVANRNGGVTKFWTNQDDCEDDNGVPGIQTSTDRDDVRPWGEDECVAWHAEFPTINAQRPVQWTPGQLNPQTCEFENQKVWTIGGRGDPGTKVGLCDAHGVWVFRLNGDTGLLEDQVHIPENQFPCPETLASGGPGPYGAAVDGDGNLWFHARWAGKLARVDAQSLTYETFTAKGYGITVDREGRVWLSGSTQKNGPGKIQRFDYAAKSWDVIDDTSANGGIAEDRQGRMWFADVDSQVSWMDKDSMMVLGTLTINDVVPLGTQSNAGNVKGVSVDVDGYIWVTRRHDPVAHRIDPDTLDIDFYNGLDDPYTYSDMTGGAINAVACAAQ